MSEPTRRIYASTLGVPPLKMVLVHARNEAQNAAYRPVLTVAKPESHEEAKPVEKREAIRRIIEALEESD
jgi:hypothetical protein